MRTGSAAISWAKSQGHWHTGMCQQFVRSCFGVGSYFPSAAAAWHGAQKRHTLSGDGSSAPAGVPVYWLGGSRGFGHIALSLGNGYVRSTDWPSSGRVGVARISDISRSWNQHLVGWSEDINRVTIYHPTPPKPKFTIELANVVRATEKGVGIPRGSILKKALAAEVGKGHMDLRTKDLGPAWREQYKKLQEKYLHSKGERVTAKNADGIPGHGSLSYLGARHGFKVK